MQGTSFYIRAMSDCSSDDGMPPVLAPSVATLSAASAQAARSSAWKQKQRALPRPIFIYDALKQLIIGACLITSVVQCPTSSANAVFELCRVVVLEELKAITKSDCKYQSSVFQLQPHMEKELRLSACKSQGTLNAHFIDFADQVWKVVRFRSEHVEILLRTNTSITKLSLDRTLCKFLAIDIGDKLIETEIQEESAAAVEAMEIGEPQAI